MELPVIQNTEVTKTIELGDKLFVIRPWKTKDEKNFMIKQTLLSKKKQENEKELEKLLIEELIKPCIIEGNIEELDYSGMRKIIVELRCISIGDDINDVSIECISCGKNNSFNISLNEEGVISYKQFNTKIYKLNEKISVRFKTIPYTKIKDDTEEYDYLYLGIDEIIYEGTSYKDFTKESFENFLDNMDIKTSKKLAESLIEASSSLEIKKSVKCLHCQEENEVDLGNMVNFYLP